MNFSTSLCLVSFSFFLGISLGSFVAMFAGSVFHRSYLKIRFSLACVFLSFAVVAFAVMLIFLPESHNLKFFTKSDVYFWLVILAGGFFISVFWKYLLIPAFLVFLVLWIHSYLFLHSFFAGQNESMFVSVQQSSMILDERLFQIDASDGRTALIKLYSLPKRLILPLPRWWFKITVLSDSQLADAADSAVFFENEDFKLENKPNMLEEWRQLFNYWLLGESEYATVRIPDSKNYPVLYNLSVKSCMDKPQIELKKTL